MKSRISPVATFLCAVLIFTPLCVSAQENSGTITGLISDPSSAPVPNAQVTITGEQTGAKHDSVSNASGEYTVPFLEPGNYDVAVQAPGFKEFVRKQVHVGAGDHARIDIPLQIGNTAETVSVTAEAPIINSENAAVGQAITEKEVEDLPLNGRTPLTLASLSIGVVNTSQPGLVHPFDLGGAAAFSIAGSASQTNEILLDGSPDATWDGRLAYSPPADAVQEVRVKAFDNDASFGHTGGGTINQVERTGTNGLHGSLYEFNQPNITIANPWFNNKSGIPGAVLHYNQYGLTVGGPIIVPKVYDGRNKLFWFFAWEGLKDSQPNSTLLTVPTQAERNGDFSGISTILYNPYSATQSGSTITRKAIPGNNLNNIAGGLNPVAVALLQYYPLPNIPAQGANQTQNYFSNAPTTDNYSNYLGRMDYNMSDRNRISFDARATGYTQVKNNYFGNNVTASDLTRDNIGGTLEDVFTLNASNVIDVRVNFTRMNETHPSSTAGFNPTTLGLPSYIASNSEYLQFPIFSLTNYESLGTSNPSILPSQSLQLYPQWVSVKGKHTFKFGTDVRQYNLNATLYGNPTGTFSFGNSFVRQSSSSSSTVAVGQDLASFLLGLPTSGSYDIPASSAWYEHYFALYVQDDWRIKSNLTINLGLRFDHDGPYYEKYGRTVDGFDATVANPIAAAAQANYAKSPIPQLPASDFNVNGGLTFPSSQPGAVYQSTSHLFSPRVGMAWSPTALGGKTVFTAGFGMFVQPLTIAQLATTDKYSTNPILNQEGFSQTTSMVTSTNNNLTPATTLSNPFPGGAIQQPIGSSLGLQTFLGQTVSFISPQEKNPYAVRWNFGIQHQLGANNLLEVVYMGNHGVHLPVAYTQLNGIPFNYLSYSPVRDQALINTLTATVNNPFYGLPNTTASTSKTTTVAQLLSTYPQYPAGVTSGGTGIIENNADIGSSYFESLNVRYEHRFSQGLSMVGNYAYSKLIEEDSWLNFPDTHLEKRISPFDHPNRFVLAITYDLPVGKRRMLNVPNRWLDAVVGGWNLNSVYTYQTGQPLLWTAGSTTSPGDYVYNGQPIDLNNRQVNGPAINLAAFDLNSADQYQYHYRTFSTTFPNLRQDATNEWDVSVLKNFIVTEKSYLQLRGEAYNVVNHPVFGAPGQASAQGPVVAETNSSFGYITFQDNRSRSLQIGARFVF
ncbi:MAG TPA: carboxypeptidase regulatory-like domain-containing protein [Bryobacteraceae bacterium]|nr:carboxypeptidase regulatory-like domain-containing protein [Bryobacteraceae bacterium]